MDDLWSASDVTPSDVDAALGDLLKARHLDASNYSPARILNLVVIADGEWRGEILNRLERVGRSYPSRTILCCVEAGRTNISARAQVSSDESASIDGPVVGHESIILGVGEHHLSHLRSIVDPLLVSDLPTVVWSPHGNPEGVDSLISLAEIVMLDSLDDPAPGTALQRAQELSSRTHVVDLSWLRGTPWRERIAGTFDPPQCRHELEQIASVTVRHRPDSAAAALLLLGWLASRLNWTTGPLLADHGCQVGKARAGSQEVVLTVQPQGEQGVPGLAGITIEMTDGGSISLDRGEGGLTKTRRYVDAKTATWTVLGTSRGEAGILGEALRQAMLRDETYGPALHQAQAMTR
ncbi:MAG: glucose-6-phosphate dehydrogenase assembly protein OpcA [Solirubrobacterales bacterium]|nr:glucose-6-phosphate dehydrogenase assembly protein OpcA [Solirubrobacterales bacterium]